MEPVREIEPVFLFAAAGFWKSRRRFAFWFAGGSETVTGPFGELSEDEIVGEAEERGQFLRGDGIGVLEGDPFCAREVGRGDNARTLGEFREGFVSGFEGEKDGSWFEWRDREHFAADFEDKVVAPLNLLGCMGEGEAKRPNGFDRIYGHSVYTCGLVCRVAAEKGIGFPLRTSGSVCGFDEEAADNFFVERGGLEIFRLIEIVGRSVVAVR